jgi:hypothetical protein
VWSYVLNGIMIAWILLIPWFLFHTFVRREGAPIDRTETLIEQEDREVGDERRARQAENLSPGGETPRQTEDREAGVTRRREEHL